MSKKLIFIYTDYGHTFFHIQKIKPKKKITMDNTNIMPSNNYISNDILKETIFNENRNFEEFVNVLPVVMCEMGTDWTEDTIQMCLGKLI